MNKILKKIFILSLFISKISLPSNDKQISLYTITKISHLGAGCMWLYMSNKFKRRTNENFTEIANIMNNEIMRLDLPMPNNALDGFIMGQRIGRELDNRERINPADPTKRNLCHHIRNLAIYGAGCIATGILGLASLKKICAIKNKENTCQLI